MIQLLFTLYSIQCDKQFRSIEHVKEISKKYLHITTLKNSFFG